MRTINLIPKNYEGDPRKAMGYCWSKYVSISESWSEQEKEAHPWSGCGPDLEKSIPGEDLKISLDDCLNMLEAEYGAIAIRDNGSYGWVKTTTKTRDGKEISIDGLEPVASITGMWCGGIQASIYIMPVCATETPKNISQKYEPAGETLEEAAAAEKMMEKIELEELGAQYKNHPGWCKKCNSFCYGDCES